MRNLESRFADYERNPFVIPVIEASSWQPHKVASTFLNTIPWASQFIPPDPQRIKSDRAIYQPVYWRRPANCNDLQFIQWLFLKYDIRKSWRELRPDLDRICRPSKFIRTLASLASSLRKIDTDIPKSTGYGIFAASLRYQVSSVCPKEQSLLPTARKYSNRDHRLVKLENGLS